MTEPDGIMTRIGHGIELSQRGEREAARQLTGDDQRGLDGLAAGLSA